MLILCCPCNVKPQSKVKEDMRKCFYLRFFCSLSYSVRRIYIKKGFSKSDSSERDTTLSDSSTKPASFIGEGERKPFLAAAASTNAAATPLAAAAADAAAASDSDERRKLSRLRWLDGEKELDEKRPIFRPPGSH